MVGASVGKTSLVLPHVLPAFRNQNMWCFRPKPPLNGRPFLVYSLKKKVSEVLSWASGSAREFFRKSDFRKHKVLMPDSLLRSRFDGLVTEFFDQISLNEAQSRVLVELRDTLLPKLLSGELDVSKVEKQLEEAT